ncbi:MAG: AAA family ATPase, partial [Terriglobia bacterium]
FNILLQVFEDGQLTDGLGNTVDFKNTIIVMTSNIGARYLERRDHLGFHSANEETTDKKVEAMVMSEVKRIFNPEFLNRVDEVIIFNALTDSDLLQIIDLLVANMNTHLAQKNISLSLSPEAARWVLETTCADRSYGARPLRRALQRHLEDPLSEALIQGEIQAPAVLEVILGSEGLCYRPVNDSLVTATPLSH